MLVNTPFLKSLHFEFTCSVSIRELNDNLVCAMFTRTADKTVRVSAEKPLGNDIDGAAVGGGTPSATYLPPWCQGLPAGPGLLVQRLVKLYLACRRNRCTLAAPSTTCLPPCSIHLPPLPVSPCFVFTALRRFSHIPGWGSHGRALHSQSGGLPGSSTRSSTQPPATSTRAATSSSFLTPARSWPPAGSPRPCPFLGVIQPRPQPHGGAETRPGVEDANGLTTD